MLLVTEKAVIQCGHGGSVANVPTQDFVYIDGKLLLIDDDPENKPIAGCPIAPPAKLSTLTHAVKAGYSDLLFIKNKGVCLKNLVGVTDGLIPNTVSTYSVVSAGQDFVSEVG